MPRIAYIECSAGASGDMLLGALIDAGLPLELLENELKALGIGGYSLSAARAHRNHIGATQFSVGVSEDSPARHWADIRAIIEKSALKETVKTRALSAFERLAECEAAIHGIPVEKVHFHELSGIDSIIDIAGACIGFDWLAAERICVSPVNVGSGVVKCSHGTLPVPAPATAALLKEVPVFSRFDGELTTPTGALLLTEFATSFGPMPLMKVQTIGYGAGSADPHSHANVLRVFIGEAESLDIHMEPVVHVQTNIDDMNPQVFPFLMERLLEAGALDAYFQQAVMKKGRPAVIFSFLCRPEDLDKLYRILLAESTTLGARVLRTERICIDRRMASVDTEFGKISIKIGIAGGVITNVMPEYEDCAAAARKAGAPVSQVMEAARAAAAVNWKNGGPFAE